MALRLGANEILDPSAGSIAERVREMTDGRGADAVIEVTGAAAALAEALRTAACSARVVTPGFLQGEARGLFLGEEFHHNRINLVSSQISGVAPEASYRWSKPRPVADRDPPAARGPADLLPLITDVVRFEEAASLFARLDAGEPGMLQAVLDFAEPS